MSRGPYQDLLLNKLTRIEGVTGVHYGFGLRRVVDRTALALSRDQFWQILPKRLEFPS